MRAAAAWRKSILSPAQLQEKFSGHAFLRGAPHTSASSIRLDILHVLDLVFSIMEELPGASRAARLAKLNQKAAETYDKIGLEAQKRMKHLSLSDLAETAEE